MFEIKGKYGCAAVMIDEIETNCYKQILRFVNHPAFCNPIVIMPDTHAGNGAVIGFTMPFDPEHVIPDVIGVDIGCGMLAYNTGRQELPIIHEELDRRVRQAVPFGQAIHATAPLRLERDFPWSEVERTAGQLAHALANKFNISARPPHYNADWLASKVRAVGVKPDYVARSLGTLGGGNHFIEFGRSQATGNIWVVVHSGSRHLGTKIAKFWQNTADTAAREQRQAVYADTVAGIKRTAQNPREIGPRIKVLRNTQPVRKATGLEWLSGEAALGYLFDMVFAQAYASVNRRLMAEQIRCVLNVEWTDSIECVHNYIDFADLVIRKGAIRSYSDERMIIPFNMRDGILLCVGESNPKWNFSAPHGAGRVLSRSAAKALLSMEIFEAEMAVKGIFSTSVCVATLDEAAGAYKSAELIEAAIQPTARILDRLAPLHNLKAVS